MRREIAMVRSARGLMKQRSGRSTTVGGRVSATQGGRAPYSHPVTTNYPTSRAVDGGILRDIAAVVLFMAGVAGLSAAAFAVDWRLGLAVLSAAAITAGVTLGYQR